MSVLLGNVSNIWLAWSRDDSLHDQSKIFKRKSVLFWCFDLPMVSIASLQFQEENITIQDFSLMLLFPICK
jgi:hypothetical protein